jgi:hypothetical protein
MRWFFPSVGIVLMTSATVSQAQGSLCNPCVDPPTIRRDFSIADSTTVVTAEEMRSLGVVSVADMVKQLPNNIASVSPEATADSPFYLGASIATMRGLNTDYGVRTLTLIETTSDESESATADDEFSDDSSDTREEESDIVSEAEQEQDPPN